MSQRQKMGAHVPVSQALPLHSYPAGYTGALPGLCELDGNLGDQDIDAKCGHSGHGVFNVFIKCNINVMGQCSQPQPQRVPVHGLGGHVTPREPMYASETDLHGTLLKGVPQRWWPESLPGPCSPDEGLEDVP